MNENDETLKHCYNDNEPLIKSVKRANEVENMFDDISRALYLNTY